MKIHRSGRLVVLPLLLLTSPAVYRAFFDFQVDGEVHTAAYTVTVE
ncbi:MULTISPECIES: hypothetical protein [unclassified Micromonospora]|jgi:hypothetical protein|nr:MULTISPECIES: hypothetical protein [unclassified Micromonospora]QKW15021.1 hypothetical protein HUT12_21065 [Verrucosispora sp. NA02020]